MVVLGGVSIALAVLVAVLFVVQGASRSRPASTTAPALAQAPPIAFALKPPWLVASASLPDVSPQGHGKSFAFRAPRRGLLLVYFGYTHCTDVCPATLANIAGALRRLPTTLAGRMAVAFITDDPRRDSTSVLDRYLSGWLSRYHALRTTDLHRFLSVERVFRAGAQIVSQGNGGTAVGHTDLVYAVDADGHAVAAWTYGVGPAQFARDFASLLEHGSLGAKA